MTRFLVMTALVFSLSNLAQSVTVGSKLKEQLARNDTSSFSVLIELSNQLDVSTLSTNGLEHRARTHRVASTLKHHFEQQSRAIRTQLNRSGSTSIRPLWIVNSIAATLSRQDLESLFAMNGVEKITLDSPKEIDPLERANASLTALDEEIGWGVEKVRAPEAWSQSLQAQGQGIIVATIDTGVNTTHPDILKNFYQNPGEMGKDSEGRDKKDNGIDDDQNGYIDDYQGWNFVDGNNDLSDSHGHGSKVAGIVAGTGQSGKKTGVAPLARILPIKTCCSQPTKILESKTWEAFQYVIEQGARVISMSISVKHYSNPNYKKWRQAGEVLLAAGVVHVNSAGNLGSRVPPKNVGAPPSNPPAWHHPSQPQTGGTTSMISVGATDKEDKLRGYSSTGPVTWESVEGYNDFPYDGGKKAGLMKPEVCGPSEVPSLAKSGDGYVASFGGTSSATPHVAGVVALLLSAKPSLTVAQVTETLSQSAILIGEAFNNQCGSGRVDSVGAIEYANQNF